MIAIGQEAPDFELPSSLTNEDGKPGKKIKLSDYRGKKAVVLAFYPLDFSPVCSGEMACFKDDLGKLEGAGAQVLGISVDSHWAHFAFAKQQGLSFPLVADFEPKGAVARSFGLYEEKIGFTSRATVIIDKAGKVAWVKNHGLGTPRDDNEIAAELAKLSLSVCRAGLVADRRDRVTRRPYEPAPGRSPAARPVPRARGAPRSPAPRRDPGGSRRRSDRR
jgi:peroxiredoxin